MPFRAPSHRRSRRPLRLPLLPLAGLALLAWAAAGECEDETRTPAHYIVFEVKEDGIPRPIHAARVAMRGALSSLPASRRARATERSADVVDVRLRSSTGRIVFETVTGVPRFLRGEFHGKTGRNTAANIDGHYLPARDRAFVVRVPSIEGAVLEVSSPAFRRSITLSLDETRLSPLVAGDAAATVATLPGWGNGDSGNRVDLLVVGDGYTAEQQTRFESDALTVVEGMFSITPYAEYRNYVNVRTLFVASNETGADQPPYDAGCTEFSRVQACCGDASASGADVVAVDTAFDATFCSYNIERLLTVSGGKVLTAAGAVPDWDQILVIVNSTRYGGSGGGFSVISLNSAAVEVAQHEYGHTFSRLADEYSSPYPNYPSCSDVDGALPACEINVTDQTDRSLLKWEKWIDPEQEVPSKSAPPVPTDAGLWQGARYQSIGMYRQGYLCIMRALGAPFCDVAAEAYAMRLYQGSWGVPVGGIDLIEPGSESPSPGNSVEPYPGVTHSARVLGPVGGPPLSYRWVLDDVYVSEGTAAPGDVVSYTMAAAPGPHTLQLRVTDNSEILHPTTRPVLARSRTWNVEILPEPTTTTTSTTSTTTSVPPSSTTTSMPTTTLVTTTTLAPTTTSTTTTTTLPATTTTSAPTSSMPPTSTSTTSSTTSTTLHEEPPCAQPTSSGPAPVASDCLYILNAAVSSVACAIECVCAPKGVLPTTATDALFCLRAATGSPVELACPCGPLP